MPKRSKNSTDGAVFTYHERRKIDHGTLHQRLPGAALKPWSHCSLNLSPPTDAVLTPDGVLFDREAILRDLLRQRGAARTEREHRREQEGRERERERERSRERRELGRKLFERKQETVLMAVGKEVQSGKEGGEGRVDASSFWVPAMRGRDPNVRVGNVDKGKVSLKTRCPISKKPLRAKDLIALRLTSSKVAKARSGEGEDCGGEGSEEGSGIYVCPVCQMVLSNAAKPVALRTGTVLCSRCVERFVVKEGTDPCTSDRIDVEKDVIPIFNVGTAFAGSAAEDPASREASLYRPSVR